MSSDESFIKEIYKVNISQYVRSNSSDDLSKNQAIVRA